MQFELLRMSLLMREQQDAFERKGPGGRTFSREEWLRVIFSEPIRFQHRKNEFHYVPETAEAADTGLLIGRIGRQLQVTENEPPEEGLHEMRRPAWRAALVIIDPTPHLDGQKVAFEHLSSLGSPLAVFTSLVDLINQRVPPEPFVIEPRPIVDERTFWDFVRAHPREITSVTFEFVAPNMFGTDDDYDREMREMQAHEKIQRAKLKLENPDGLELDTKRVDGAVKYIVRGGGSIRARTKRKQVYNSDRKIQKIVVEEAGAAPSEQKPSLLRQIFGKVFGK